MAWYKTTNVINLEHQLDRRWPNRDRTSDGTIGDEAHKLHASGHNADDTKGSRPAWDGDPDNRPEVRDKDIDSDFRERGTTAQMVVDHLRRLPGFASVCRYLIYNGYMYHYRDGFKPLPYDGDPHTEHIHYEGAWSQAADNNGSFDFRLEEVNQMSLADEKIKVNASSAEMFGGDSHIGEERSVSEFIGLAAIYSFRANKAAASVARTVTDIAARDDVDEQALGTAIGAVVGPLILAHLPQGTVLTQADLEEAFRNVLRQGVDAPAN